MLGVRRLAALDPDPVVLGPLIERLVFSESAIPLLGSLISPAYGRLWMDSCQCLIRFGNSLRTEHLQDRKVALGPFWIRTGSKNYAVKEGF